MGNPIAHSKSPEIHHSFAGQTGQSIQYERILVEPGQFPEALHTFQKEGGQGLNVTTPFKLDARQVVAGCTQRAIQAGAVNTIWFDDKGRPQGDNTDGIGLIRDLNNSGIHIQDKRILILGAGGAVRGVLGPLLDQVPGTMTLVNRTHSKAVQLVSEFKTYGGLNALDLDKLEGHEFDVIINGTAASLDQQLLNLPDSIVTGDSQCYDLSYSTEDTVFVKWAKDLGAKTAIDGLGMLVEQAAEAFYIWRSVRPNTDSVIQQLKTSA